MEALEARKAACGSRHLGLQCGAGSVVLGEEALSFSDPGPHWQVDPDDEQVLPGRGRQRGERGEPSWGGEAAPSFDQLPLPQLPPHPPKLAGWPSPALASRGLSCPSFAQKVRQRFLECLPAFESVNHGGAAAAVGASSRAPPHGPLSLPRLPDSPLFCFRSCDPRPVCELRERALASA